MKHPPTEFPTRKYLEAAEALERIRVQEAAAMTDEEALRKLHSLGTIQNAWRDRPNWSGLVEQQALFMRPRKS
ncbi:MAG TPA: hypothetical protein VHQ47_12805 [Phycisphaerae bacterium]|nr:hypothetical protein [Phycisphaerae bacterium]